jgi:hypothetical protein
VAKDFTPLAEHQYGHMMFRVRGGPFHGKVHPVYFDPLQRPRVGSRFMFSVADEMARVYAKGKGKIGMAEYEVTKLPEGDWDTLQTEVGELTWVNEKGELEQ